MRLPHPIPYQGSKRSLASRILAHAGPVRRLYEPFAGSAALTLAAAHAGLAEHHVIGDTLAPLVEIWRLILDDPAALADRYARIWEGQRGAGEGYFDRVRTSYNASGDPAGLLYLLARCVKNSPRWNRDGAFNQSRDKRRLGMRPEKMRKELLGASALLAGRTTVVEGDFERTLADAEPCDLAYLDPPWQGTSAARDTRYHAGLERERLVAVLSALNARGVPWIVSYDGRSGTRTYGRPLPPSLGATLIPLNAGRSSQATLQGRSAVTVESLYVRYGRRPRARD